MGSPSQAATMTFWQVCRSWLTWGGDLQEDLRVLQEAGHEVVGRLPEALQEGAELGNIVNAAQDLLELPSLLGKHLYH